MSRPKAGRVPAGGTPRCEDEPRAANPGRLARLEHGQRTDVDDRRPSRGHRRAARPSRSKGWSNSHPGWYTSSTSGAAGILQVRAWTRVTPQTESCARRR